MSDDDRLEMDPRGFYVASKRKHASMWRKLRAEGYRIAASWIDGIHPQTDVAWTTNLIEVRAARALILYGVLGESPKGSCVELGAALALGVPVYYVGPPGLLTALAHPGVIHCRSIRDALHRAVEDT